VTDFLDPKRRDRLKRWLDTLPELAALAQVVADTLLPRRGGHGGSRPHPGSRPPVSLGLIDTLDARPKRQGRYAGSGADTIATSGDDMADAVQLETWAARQQGKDTHNVDGKPPAWSRDTDEVLRLSVDAKGAREGILRNLGDWVRICVEEMDEALAAHTEPAGKRDVWVVDSRGDCWAGFVETATITTEAGWLSMHLDWIAQQQWSDELAEDVHRMHRDLKRIIGEGRPEYRPLCTGCSTDIRRQRMRDEGAYFTCPNCGRQVRDGQMDHRQALATEQPMDSQSFGWAGVSSERIRKWVERGELGPALDEQGQVMKRGKRHLYHPLDVLRVRDEMGA
jgi:predicted RNA-binding Zn-ribbon protein involved in translation (DUF1610 family)